MAISDTQKIDYLWKKIGYAATKTDTAANKDATNEEIASPLLLRGDKTWNQADQIPGTLPASSSGVVTVYATASPVECTVLNTASTNRSWKTNSTDWIPPEFGSTYLAKVYIHTSANAGTAASGGTQVFGAGSGNNDEWFFDYQSGVLHFIGTNLPNGVSFTGKSVYVSGARYTGTIGLQNLTTCLKTKGVYEVTIPPLTGYKTPCMFTDIWSNLKLNGFSLQNQINEFTVYTFRKSIQIGTSTNDPSQYGFSYYGIKQNEYIYNTDIRKVGVVIKQAYTTNKLLPNVDAHYRVYVREGQTEVQVQDWTKINKTPNEYYFMFDTRDKIPNEYYIDLMR